MIYHKEISNTKDIAIIMATYNGEKYIAEQVESILNNNCQDFVIHICDDGSTDATLEICEKYALEYPGMIEIHRNEQNLRVIKNMLSWTATIDSKYYMFCDQDDYWNSDKIQKSYDFIKMIEQNYPNKPVAIFTDAEVVNEKLETIHPSFQKHEMLSSYKLELGDLLMENKLLGCSVMFNKETQAILKRMDEIPCEIRMHDWWIGLIGAAFGKVAYLDEPLLKYRQHGDNEVGSLGALGYIFSNLNKLTLQRELLYALFKQGECFLDMYRELLKDNQINYLKEFSSFYKKSWIVRKYLMIKNGYRKTGIVRNIGMLLLL